MPSSTSVKQRFWAPPSTSFGYLGLALAGLVAELHAQGTTTFEVKTGYDLTVAGEARLARLARAGGGGEDGVKVGDGLGHAGKHGDGVQHPVGARGRGPGPLLGPAVAGADQTQV